MKTQGQTNESGPQIRSDEPKNRKPPSIFPIEDRSSGGFTQISSSILEDSRLSHRAKGILLYLLSRPGDWKVRVSDVQKHGIEGKQSVRAGLKELEDHRYIRRTRRPGSRSGDVWEVFEDPKVMNAEPRNPDSLGSKRIHRIGKRKAPFTQMSNAVIHDENRSFKAKGILAYLLSSPPSWTIYLKNIEAHGKEGREAIRSGINELIQAGHIEHRLKRSTSTGQLEGHEYKVFEDPNDQRKTLMAPSDGNPNDGSPNDGHSPPTKKEKNNIDKNNIPPKSPQLGGPSDDIFPGDEKHDNAVALDSDGLGMVITRASKQSFPWSRISELPPEQALKAELSLHLVSIDPIAQQFHEIFPKPDWNASLARSFCKLVKKGSATNSTIGLFRWDQRCNPSSPARSEKGAVMKNWDKRVSHIRTMATDHHRYLKGKHERFVSEDSVAGSTFAHALIKGSPKYADTEQPPLVADSVGAQFFLAHTLRAILNNTSYGRNAAELDDEALKLLRREIVENGDAFHSFEQCVQDFDSEQVFGVSWETIIYARENALEKLEDELHELKSLLG